MKRGRITVFLMTCSACISILYICGVYIGRPTISTISSHFDTTDAAIQRSSFEDRREHYMHLITLYLPNQMPTGVSSKVFASSFAVGSHAASTAQPAEQEPSMNSVAVAFDPHGADTTVYLHIQKTGGSAFLEHLVTAQIPFRGYSHPNKLPFPARVAGSELHHQRGDWRTSWIPLCKTSPTGGWTRDVSYLGNGSTVDINHEICPRDWKHLKGETWLVSEKTTAWNCGVHAFYADFKRCLSNPTVFNLKAKRKSGRVALLSKQNRFHYVVLLRHPLLRYISEYMHVSRGACWKRNFVCNGKVVKNRKPPTFGCPEHFQCDHKRVAVSLIKLTLERFAKCQDSWSVNRMTVSLADHEEATCWNKTRYTRKERDQLLLASAKSNLLNFSYFGINEFPLDSGALFEETFGVVLRNPIQNLSPVESKAGQFLESLKADKYLCKQVIDNNRLDMELYEYALDIFNSRMRTIGRQLDPHTLNYIHSLNDIMHTM